MIQYRRGELHCDRLVDLTHIPELKEIQVHDGPHGRIFLGAAVTVAEILENLPVITKIPLLAQACGQFGGPQIRSLATVGGNVINQAACADLLPVLVCLGAETHVASPQGEFCVPVSDLASHPFPDGRLVRSFSLPLPPESSRSVFLRLARRKTLVTARLSLTMLGSLSADGTIVEARIVPSAIFSKVRRVSEVEGMLVGQTPSGSLYKTAGERMAELFMAESGNRWSAPYKKLVVANLTERGLRMIYGN
jgi:CO/xanthine dehydrogenase FAD-binding subunit